MRDRTQKRLDVDGSSRRRAFMEQRAGHFRRHPLERERGRNALSRVLERALLQPRVVEREADLLQLGTRLLQRRARLFGELGELAADGGEGIAERLLRS